MAFAKGEAIGYAELNFGSVDKLSATGKYEIILAINDKSTLSPAQSGEITVTAQRRLTWEDYGTGVYSSETSSWTGCPERKCTGMWQEIILLQIQ